jgi:hypothetical protein
MIDGGRFDFQGDSDAMIVRGLIAVLHALYAGVPLAEVAKSRRPRRTWPAGAERTSFQPALERGARHGAAHPRGSR